MDEAAEVIEEAESATLGDILSDKDLDEVSVKPAEEEDEGKTGEQQTDEEKAEAERLAAEEAKAAEEAGKSDEEKAAEAKAEEERLAAEAAIKPEESEEVKGLKAALHAERSKRQALEVKQPEKKEFWEDPEGAIKEAGQTVEQRLQQTVLTISENAARARHEDFDVKYDAFVVSTQSNPTLIDQMNQQADPAEFVYQHGAKELLLQSIGDPVEYEQKMTAKIKTELQTEFDTKLKEEIAKLAKLPHSGADAAGEGQSYSDTDVESKDTPLSEL